MNVRFLWSLVCGSHAAAKAHGTHPVSALEEPLGYYGAARRTQNDSARVAMFTPLRAPVSPRITAGFDQAPVLLEDEVRDCLDRQADRICVYGSHGAGKTVALRHLAVALAEYPQVRYVDAPRPEELEGIPDPVVFTALRPWPTRQAVHWCELAPWSEDDLIEYLLAIHRSECGSVIQRLHQAADTDLLGGVPELCRVVLDYMADHPASAGARASLFALLKDNEQLARVLGLIRIHTAEPLGVSGAVWTQVRRWLLRSSVGEEEIRLLRHAPVQTMLSAEVLIRDLAAGAAAWVKCGVSHEVIEEAAARVASSPQLLADLEDAMPVAAEHEMPMIASILHEVSEDWRPPRTGRICLRGAHLCGARWRGLDLSRVHLEEARLAHADLRWAILRGSCIKDADLQEAHLSRADLTRCAAQGADFTRADLGKVRARSADFSRTVFVDADCEEADLRWTIWKRARLNGTDFVGADLSSARMDRADVQGADFSGVNFSDASLSRLDLRETLMLGASFGGARLVESNLEGMILPDVEFTGADLTRAKLTGSIMPGICFRNARLVDAELADVDWEGADLRGADLRGARFQGDPLRQVRVGDPGLGDDRSDPEFETMRECLPPEAIRRANLRGVDLRDTKIEGVNFYLVDLREARCDRLQAVHLRRTGAILGS